MAIFYCVDTTIFGQKLSCGVGDLVNLRISESGKSKVKANACGGPCNPNTVVGGTIVSVCLVENKCDGYSYKYTIKYDSGVLNSADSPLVASDISLVSCV